jgi:hypothetical protein
MERERSRPRDLRPIACWRIQIIRLAPIPRLQRTDRNCQQSRETRQASRIRHAELRTPPHPITAVRRPTQLKPLRHHHPTVKSEVPVYRPRGARPRPSD